MSLYNRRGTYSKVILRQQPSQQQAKGPSLATRLSLRLVPSSVDIGLTDPAVLVAPFPPGYSQRGPMMTLP